MSGKRDYFNVKVSKEEVVAASLPLQEHWLPQSNLDLLIPPVDVGVFFCYKKKPSSDIHTFGSLVGVLKKALAETLVSYYAFAGEMVQNVAGEPELLCNNRGVDFIQAFADVELQELNLYNPDETLDGKLLPIKKQGVLAVQASELKCGGLILGCKFDHRVADAYSANMFFESWAEMACAKPISTVPSFRRSLLCPRRPGGYDSSVTDMYLPLSKSPTPPHDLMAGYVMPMPSATGKNGDWIVYMHLLKEQIEAIETYGSNVFEPITIGHFLY
ncbi:hypothetical protein ACH5RR_014974 [Cinchona calisaya]|uniref:Uncharacterized protein n=1 Tax=Cinchona calisaya TaxID=153742 RepID=A0ABD2ZRS9_9GENT